jgi:formylglycine-generating enzyme required for sulfatase activity
MKTITMTMACSTVLMIGCTIPRTTQLTGKPVSPKPTVESVKARADARTVPLGEDAQLNLVKVAPARVEKTEANGEIGYPTRESLEVVDVRRGDIWIATTPVSERQWRQVLGNAVDGTERAANMKTHVSPEECRLFCRKLTEREQQAGRITKDQEYRLPTETEWLTAMSTGNAGATGIDRNTTGFEWCLSDGTAYANEPRGVPVAMTAGSAGGGRALVGPDGRIKTSGCQGPDSMLGFRVVIAATD